MKETEQLSGKKLEEAFVRSAYREVIGGVDGPLVAVIADGKVAVFADKANPPEILICDISGDEALAVFGILQKYGASFETDLQHSAQVRCTIVDTVAVGENYLIAGMRAYVMYAASKKLKV